MSELAGRAVVVAGAGVAGIASAVALRSAGARVQVLSKRVNDPDGRLTGIPVSTDTATLPPGTELVVTSPGLRPDHPLLTAGVPVWGEVELAWRLRRPDAADWLALTGTNGKTTTVGMLAAILAAAGLRTRAVGNVGYPLVDAVTGPARYDVLAVELSSAQLHFTTTVRPAGAALLNLAPDHLDWHGDLAAYAADKGRILRPGGRNVINADDPWCRRLAAGLPDPVGFTLGEPDPGQLGVVDGWLVDAAGQRLIPTAAVRPPGPHNRANALAAAALARGYGVSPAAVRAGLEAFTPAAHRNQLVGTVAGVSYVDDSKATNPHAAGASLGSYDPIVWVAGGLLKGADVDELVRTAAPRLRAAVLLGADREEIAQAIARHAPDLPVERVDNDDDEPMKRVVAAAHRLARVGDTVLLAPAAASWDMFANYAARGDAFAAAVAELERR